MHRPRRVVAFAAVALASACSAALACSDHASPLCLCPTGASALGAASFTVEPAHTHGGGAPGSQPGSVLVHVFNFEYSAAPAGPPVDPIIEVGDTIHWQWDSGFHSVTTVAGSTESFDSTVLVGPGPTYDHTFTHAGVYQYFCTLHGFDNGNGTAGGMAGIITVNEAVVTSAWNVDFDGSWQTASNWSNGVPNGAGHSAYFQSNITGPRGITVDAPVSVGTLLFDSPSPKSYTIAGSSTLSLAGAGANDGVVDVRSGNHTITAPLQPATHTKFLVSGSLTVSNLQASDRVLQKAGDGTLTVNNIRTTAGLNVIAGLVAVATNGTNSGASQVGTLSIAGGAANGRLDLRDNDLMVLNSSYAAITGLIRSARNGGSWNGTGLTSSAAADAVPKNKTLGVMVGSDYLPIGGNGFAGFHVPDNAVLVKFTYYGDTDFNGIINFDDYSRTDAGFNTGGADWLHGDFDFNGIVNFDDYSLIDLAFNTQSGSLRQALAYLDGNDRDRSHMNTPELNMVLDHFDQFGLPYAQGFLNAVPEPASAIALAGVQALACMRVRRRRANQ